MDRCAREGSDRIDELGKHEITLPLIEHLFGLEAGSATNDPSFLAGRRGEDTARQSSVGSCIHTRKVK